MIFFTIQKKVNLPHFQLKCLFPEKGPPSVRASWRGWMKIDHYRNHHVPLKIYEQRREAANNKFLSIKYRYTKDKRKTPVAWAKYRSRVASESWETDDRRSSGLFALWGKLRLKALWGKWRKTPFRLHSWANCKQIRHNMYRRRGLLYKVK